jgi:vesicle-fusing ATPase
MAALAVRVDLIKKSANSPKVELDVDEMSSSFISQFNGQIFRIGQEIGFNFKEIKLHVIIDPFEFATTGSSNPSTELRGRLSNETKLTFQKHKGSQSNILFTGASASMAQNDSLFRTDFDFTKMGIGGLNTQFQTMFRRAFASRLFPGIVKKLGINHIRGILLYGPPGMIVSYFICKLLIIVIIGCGKTLIARQIGRVLNAREPKIINGPEVLDKYVGGSQEKIRALFVDAEKEQAAMGGHYLLNISTCSKYI